ncbi:Leucine-tRNA ligase like protein, partial [Aduncisulcus paluster]
KKTPIYIANYVMMDYGTGAIMAVPAHDERDFEFATKYDIEIIPVIRPEDDSIDINNLKEAYTGSGLMMNSGEFDGLEVQEGQEKIVDWMDSKGIGNKTINYRLRDWLISRQRYWGTPIPIIECPDCGYVPVPDSELPVVLPKDVEFTGEGESPLTTSES